MAAANKLREELAQKFLEALSQGQLPWHACWATGRPENAINGKIYRGINALALSYTADDRGYTDPRWCTYNQAREKGWQVRKGEKSARVEYWAYYDTKEKKGEFELEYNQKTELKQWHIVYAADDPLDGGLEIVPAQELNHRAPLASYYCSGQQEAAEKLARYEQLQRCFWEETGDPETQQWRDDLTADEAVMVEQWDRQTEQGIAKLSAAILEQEERLLPPSQLMELAERYPGLTREQLAMVAEDLHAGKSPEDISVYAKPDFATMQMDAIRYAQASGLNGAQLGVLAQPHFLPIQMDIIRNDFLWGMTTEQVQSFAQPGVTPCEMLLASKAIRGELTAEETALLNRLEGQPLQEQSTPELSGQAPVLTPGG